MKTLTALYVALTLAVAAAAAHAQSTRPADLAERWSVRTVRVVSASQLIAERGNPLPLYSGVVGWPQPPAEVPIVGNVRWYAQHTLGLYPVLKDGGTPIGSDLAAHLAKVRDDLARTRDSWQDAAYVGIDYEAWQPDWGWLDDDYKQLAREQVAERNPDARAHLSDAAFEKLAAATWEAEATRWLVATIETVREATGKPVVGYGYPARIVWARDDSGDDRHRTLKDWRRHNDAYLPVVLALDALGPSIYHFYPDNDVDGEGYVRRVVGEARRLADAAEAVDGKRRPVLAWVWHLYHNSAKLEGRERLLRAADARADVLVAAEAGADGLILFADRPEDAGQFWSDWSEVYAEPYTTLLRQTMERRSEDNQR